MNATKNTPASIALKVLRAIIKAILDLAKGLLSAALYIFTNHGAAQRRRELDQRLDAQDAERERALSDADAMLREAARLDRERAEKTKLAAEAAQMEMNDFRIKTIKLAPDLSAALIGLEAGGYKFSWRAPLDEDCRIVVDEEMPEALVDAIKKTDDPSSTLKGLAALIQGQVDRLIAEMHESARRRRAAERDIVEIVPPSSRVEFAK